MALAKYKTARLEFRGAPGRFAAETCEMWGFACRSLDVPRRWFKGAADLRAEQFI
jgi:hypothetical protein